MHMRLCAALGGGLLFFVVAGCQSPGHAQAGLDSTPGVVSAKDEAEAIESPAASNLEPEVARQTDGQDQEMDSKKVLHQDRRIEDQRRAEAIPPVSQLELQKRRLELQRTIDRLRGRDKQEQQRKRSYKSLPEESFLHARPGEFWVIKSESVALMHKPEAPLTRDEFVQNSITVLDAMSKVEIVESKGWLSPWKRAYLVRDRDNARLLHGWILAETVKRASKLSLDDNLVLRRKSDARGIVEQLRENGTITKIDCSNGGVWVDGEVWRIFGDGEGGKELKDRLIAACVFYCDGDPNRPYATITIYHNRTERMLARWSQTAGGTTFY